MKFIYNSIKHYFAGCEDTQLKIRKVMINDKKNKPPEIFIEAKKVCLDCDNVVEQAYLPYREKGD